MQTKEQVIGDFDRLAALDDGAGNSEQYQSYLLEQLPQPCKVVAEIGCGAGSLTRALVERAERVIAVDFSPGMIEVARRRSARFSNIEYQLADAREWSVPAGSLDCCISVATLHHLDHEAFLARARTWLRPGGRLLVLDLRRDDGLWDAILSAISLPYSAWLRWRRTGHWRQSRELQEAWREHGSTDRYLSFAEARDLYCKALPDAIVQRHLLWRYTVVWTKTTTVP